MRDLVRDFGYANVLSQPMQRLFCTPRYRARATASSTLFSCILEEGFDGRLSESSQSLRNSRVKLLAGGCQYCLD